MRRGDSEEEDREVEGLEAPGLLLAEVGSPLVDLHCCAAPHHTLDSILLPRVAALQAHPVYLDTTDIRENQEWMEVTSVRCIASRRPVPLPM